jgi:hypothetical protein
LQIFNDKLTEISLVLGAIKATVCFCFDDAHTQQLSTINNFLIAISTFANETYSPLRILTTSFLRSKIQNNKNKSRNENTKLTNQ